LRYSRTFTSSALMCCSFCSLVFNIAYKEHHA
jgi:hypothetical protein